MLLVFLFLVSELSCWHCLNVDSWCLMSSEKCFMHSEVENIEKLY